MQQVVYNNNNAASKMPVLPNITPRVKPLHKADHAKNCKYRTAEGFCTRSSRTCPATLFTVTFNQ